MSPRSQFLVWFQVTAGPKKHVRRLGRWMGSSSLHSLQVNAKCQVRLKPWRVTACCWPALFQRPVPVLTAALPPFSSPGQDRLCVQLPSEGFNHLLYSFTSLGVKDVGPGLSPLSSCPDDLWSSEPCHPMHRDLPSHTLWPATLVAAAEPRVLYPPTAPFQTCTYCRKSLNFYTEVCATCVCVCLLV